MIRRARTRVFHGWWIVISGFLIQLLISGLLQRSFGAYLVLFRDQFGWSKTALSGAFSLQQVENGLLGPLQGGLIDRFGPRASMRVGIVFFGVGFITLSQMNSLLTFYLAFASLAIGSSISGFFPITVTVISWFERRRTRALALVSLGFAVGGLLVPIVAFVLEEFGWRGTAFASGILVIVVGIPLTQVFRKEPSRPGEYVDGIEPKPAAENDARRGLASEARQSRGEASFTAREAIRTPAFWLISLGHSASLLVVQAVNVHLIVHLNESLGYSLATASLAVTMLTAFQIVGNVIGGELGDRYSKRLITTLTMVLHASGLLVLAFASNLPMVIAFALLHGIGWGVRGPLMQAIRADYFGTRSIGMIVGLSSMITMIGNTSGPLIAGALADATGNYQLGFTLLAILAGLGSGFFFMAKKPAPPARSSSPGPGVTTPPVSHEE